MYTISSIKTIILRQLQLCIKYRSGGSSGGSGATAGLAGDAPLLPLLPLMWYFDHSYSLPHVVYYLKSVQPYWMRGWFPIFR